MAHYKTEQDDWLIVYLKYLLFVFNFFFWVGGAAVLAVGIWTLVEKSGYLSVLASSTFAASAYILIFAGALVMVTGFLGFGAILREQKGCLSTYFCLLLVIFLVELVAGVLAHVYYQRLSDELKQHLNQTLAENYGQPGATQITASVDRLQQDFKCCGSNSSADWQHSTYILSREAEGRRVPDSCCKTVVTRCGQRAHPSNIYKVEVSTQAQAGGEERALAWPFRSPRKAGSGKWVWESRTHVLLGHEPTVPGAFQSLYKALGQAAHTGESRTPRHAPGSTQVACGQFKARSSL
ncbi:tetraspanin-11 isoform X1 [Papio anubis]|uniref:tetraspanin-11 isoform X1 n=1 Tax=Papio anubis TaxID=9555 RepID=UPI0012ADA300|nr:tetraspanin-11 isoform X1 [Papio anubis]XP_031506263.1 tetraspanin-11 isoform X1 [Papio anubis]